MQTPEQATNPQGRKRAGAMQAKPPGFKWLWLQTERPLALEEIVENKPKYTVIQVDPRTRYDPIRYAPARRNPPPREQ